MPSTKKKKINREAHAVGTASRVQKWGATEGGNDQVEGTVQNARYDSGTRTNVLCFPRLLPACVELPGLRLLTVRKNGPVDSSIFSSKAS